MSRSVLPMVLLCSLPASGFIVPSSVRRQQQQLQQLQQQQRRGHCLQTSATAASATPSSRTDVGSWNSDTDSVVVNLSKSNSSVRIVEELRGAMQQGAAAKAELILSDMLKRYETNSGPTDPVAPNVYHFTMVLGAWARSRSAKAPQEAERLLQKMYDHHQAGTLQQIKPNSVSYTSVIDCWSKSQNPRAPERAKEILNTMKEKYAAGEVDVRPNARTYNAALKCFVNSGRAEEARDLLQEMFEDYHIHLNSDARPDTTSFNIVLSAWSRSRSPDAPRRAEATVLRMKEHYATCQFETKPDIITYNTLIDVWAKSRHKDALSKAEAILHHVQAMDDLQPDIVTFHSVMSAYAKRGDAKKANQILSILIDDYLQSKRVGIKPKNQTFNIVLNALSRSSAGNAPERGEELFATMKAIAEEHSIPMLRPNAVTYNSLINIWSKAKRNGNAKRAEALLMEMQEHYQNSQDRLVKPNVISYSTVLDAWARQGDAVAAQKLLEHMLKEFEEGNYDARPNVRSFTAVLSAWSRSRSPDAPQQAEELIAQMIDLHKSGKLPDAKPNAVSYTMLIDCYAKSNKQRDAARKADQLLQDMKQRYQSGERELKPSVITYSAVIVAWSHSGEPEAVANVESLLEEMLKLAKKGDEAVSPDVKCYNAVIRTIAFSKLPDKLQRTEKLVQMMKDSGITPDYFTKKAVRIFTKELEFLST